MPSNADAIFSEIREYWSKRGTREWFIFGKQPMPVRRVSSQTIGLSSEFCRTHSLETINKKIADTLHWYGAGYASLTKQQQTELLPKIQAKNFDYNPYPTKGIRDTSHIVVTKKRKKCHKCGKSRKAKFFGKDARSPDGMHDRCKFCQREDYNKRHGGNVKQRELRG